MNEVTPTSVKPGASIIFTYEIEPIRFHGVKLWKDTEETIHVPGNGNQFTVPIDSGTYVFSISADWERGDASHAFIIKVE